MPRWVSWFFFNLRKKGQLHTYILYFYEHYPLTQKLVTSHIASYILEKPDVGSTAANEFILAPFSKQIDSFHSPLGTGG
jgi:hypothetical protein